MIHSQTQFYAATIIFFLAVFGLFSADVNGHEQFDLQADQFVYLPIVHKQPDKVIYYVSKNGNNGNGRSWESAWNELDQINWDIIRAGDFVYVDGGSSSMTYTTSLRPEKSGSVSKPITIQLAPVPGRDGQVIMFGGNGVLLPECGQRSWDESQLANAEPFGIQFRNEIENIVVDGRKRSGFVIHGWSQNGVRFFPDTIDNGIDDNPQNITLKYLEIYNNGEIERKNDGSVSNLYYPLHSRPGISLAGSGHTFSFLEIHDNAADAIQSAYTNPSGGVFNNLDDFTITDSWLYNSRVHSGTDNSPAGEVCSASSRGGCDELGAPQMGPDYPFYPDFPSNRRESFNWCTHSDGIQIYSSGEFNNLSIERTFIGPNFMNGLILGNNSTSNETAWVDNLVLKDVVITRFMHNALGMNNQERQSGENWHIENVTIYGHYSNLHKGTLQLDLIGGNQGHTIANSYMLYGQSSFGTDQITFTNNCEFGMYKGTINGKVEDPRFRRLTNKDFFKSNPSEDFATVFTDNYFVTNPECQNVGSRVTSITDLLSAFK